jgi:peroxiredoxin family protein
MNNIPFHIPPEVIQRMIREDTTASNKELEALQQDPSRKHLVVCQTCQELYLKIKRTLQNGPEI